MSEKTQILVIIGCFLLIFVSIFAGCCYIEHVQTPPPNQLTIVNGVASDKFIIDTVGGEKLWSVIITHDDRADIAWCDTYTYAQIQGRANVNATWDSHRNCYKVTKINQ